MSSATSSETSSDESAVAADGDRRRLLGDLVELGLLDVDSDQMQPRRDYHGGERQRHPPAEEDQPDLVGAHVEGEWCERQQREEAKVVQHCGDCDAEQAAVAQRAEWVGQRGGVFGTRGGRQQERGDNEREGHQRRHPEERSTPGDRAEDATDERADRDADERDDGREGNGPNGLGLAPHTVRLLLFGCYLVGVGAAASSRSRRSTRTASPSASRSAASSRSRYGSMAAPRSTRTCRRVSTPFGVMRISTARASSGSTVRDTRAASSSRRTWVVIVGCEQSSSAARSDIRASPWSSIVDSSRAWAYPSGMRTRCVASRLIRATTASRSAPSVAVMTPMIT